VEQLNYIELRSWMLLSSEVVLREMADQMVKVYFGSA
jgi:hypothetical protein